MDAQDSELSVEVLVAVFSAAASFVFALISLLGARRSNSIQSSMLEQQKLANRGVSEARDKDERKAMERDLFSINAVLRVADEMDGFRQVNSGSVLFVLESYASRMQKIIDAAPEEIRILIDEVFEGLPINFLVKHSVDEPQFRLGLRKLRDDLESVRRSVADRV